MDNLDPILRGVGLVGAIASAYWVWQDSRRLKQRGAPVSRGLWTVLTALAWLPTLPAYLFLRSRYWRAQLGPASELEPAKSPGHSSEPRAETEPKCSEAAIRTLAQAYAGRSRNEAWRELQEHYYRHSCADELDLDRFEEIVADVLR